MSSSRRVPVITLVFCAGMMFLLTRYADAATQAGFGDVQLLRDQWGVPHVFADTDAGAMYGLGYATAADRGFQMYYTLRIIQGRLAEVVGDVGKVRRKETAVQNDRKMRTFGFARAARQRIRELDRESVELLDAYARGVNAYFDQHRDRLPELFARTGLRPEPWTAADCLLSWWHLAQFFATDGTRDLLRFRNLGQQDPRARMQGRAVPPGRGGGRGRAGRPMMTPPADLKRVPQDDSAAVVGRDDVTESWIEKTRAFLTAHGFDVDASAAGQGTPVGPKFSHAWVADGHFSKTGSAVLVSMPQTNVANPSLFYEFHIHGKTMDARGAGVAGSPIILIGWNRHVAWGMTALGADQADLFRLKTDAAHPGQYLFDGKWLPIKMLRESIQVKGGASQELTIRETRFGPIVNQFAFARPADPPVALKRIPMCDTGHDTIVGGLAMMRATNVAQFMTALEQWRFPTANVLVGDRDGNIAYSTIGALPLRAPLAPDNGAAAHDGSAAKFDWQAIIPQDLVPHVVNPKEGYLFSGNHRPVGAFYPIPIGISTGSMGDSLRSWRLRQLLTGKKSMTAQQLLDMVHDSTNPARQAVVRAGFHLRDTLKTDLRQEAQRALTYLEPWFAQGAPSRLDVKGAELATLINTQFRFINTDLAFAYGGGESGLSHFLKTLNHRMDENPKAPITPLEKAYIERLLVAAWNSAKNKWGDDPGTWNAQARQEVTRGRLGYYESLDGFPTLDRQHDMPMPPLACVDRATVFSQAGQAYVQWVPLANVDQARSLCPPGQSELPDSPTRTVNVDGWVHGRLHAAPLSRAALEPLITSRHKLLPRD